MRLRHFRTRIGTNKLVSEARRLRNAWRARHIWIPFTVQANLPLHWMHSIHYCDISEAFSTGGPQRCLAKCYDVYTDCEFNRLANSGSIRGVTQAQQDYVNQGVALLQNLANQPQFNGLRRDRPRFSRVNRELIRLLLNSIN